MADSAEPLYVDDSTFKVLDDRTGALKYTRKIKLNCGTDGVRYTWIESSIFDGEYTVVTLGESKLTPNITTVYYALITAGEEGNIPYLTDYELKDIPDKTNLDFGTF